MYFSLTYELSCNKDHKDHKDYLQNLLQINKPYQLYLKHLFQSIQHHSYLITHSILYEFLGDTLLNSIYFHIFYKKSLNYPVLLGHT